MFKLVKVLVMVCCFVAISGLNLAVSFAQNPNFNQVLYWDNYSFSIKEDGDKLIIKPKNLAIVNRKEVHDIVGYTVNDVQIADLNDDGYPEVLVYLTNDGSGSYGNLIGYSSNNGKSMSQIALSPIEDMKALAKYYRGHDYMQVKGNVFTRTFPLYLEEDTNANPTGGICEIQYKLVDGEACRILKLVKYTIYNIVDEKVMK